jgi:hypothetical protein
MPDKVPASRADHYRKRAEEIRKKASETRNDDERRNLDEIARLYLRIADDLEKTDPTR